MSTETDTRKAHEGDVVELLEDFPDFGLKKGQRGIVITEFDEPAEAYDLEMEDESGEFVGFAYSVKPHQLANLSRDAFERGWNFLVEGELSAAYKELRYAIQLRHSYIGTLLRHIVEEYAKAQDWESAEFFFRFLIQLDPSYQHARDNLAITFLNWGVEQAKQANFPASLIIFNRALAVESTPEITAKVRENIAATHHHFGVQAFNEHKPEDAQAFMRMACAFFPDERTRRNLGNACALLGRHYIDRGNYGGAIATFEEAEDAGVVSPELLNDYAIALVFTGSPERARLALERALELEPESTILRENLMKLERSEPKETLTGEDIKPTFIPVPLTAPQSFYMAAAA